MGFKNQGKNQDPASLEGYLHKYVALTTPSGMIYGRITNVDLNYVTLKDSPTQTTTKKGARHILRKDPTHVPRDSVSVFSLSSKDEIVSLVENVNPLVKYLDKPVTLTNGTGNHHGIVSAVYDNSILLLPSLVPQAGEHGQRYRRETKTPVFIASPIEISPISEEDLDFLIEDSRRDYEISKRKRLLELKQMEEMEFRQRLELMHLDEVEQEMSKQNSPNPEIPL